MNTNHETVGIDRLLAARTLALEGLHQVQGAAACRQGEALLEAALDIALQEDPRHTLGQAFLGALLGGKVLGGRDVGGEGRAGERP